MGMAMCADVCIDMCADEYIDMCVNMCIDMRIEIRTVFGGCCSRSYNGWFVVTEEPKPVKTCVYTCV